jgi:hypothetical protein
MCFELVTSKKGPWAHPKVRLLESRNEGVEVGGAYLTTMSNNSKNFASHCCVFVSKGGMLPGLSVFLLNWKLSLLLGILDLFYEDYSGPEIGLSSLDSINSSSRYGTTRSMILLCNQCIYCNSEMDNSYLETFVHPSVLPFPSGVTNAWLCDKNMPMWPAECKKPQLKPHFGFFSSELFCAWFGGS